MLTTIFRDATPYNGTGRALSVVDWLKHVRERIGQRFGDRPELRVELTSSGTSSLVSPKSRTTTRPSAVTSTFDGLRSRWIFPSA